MESDNGVTNEVEVTNKSKIRIKVGSIEMEYEGNEDFLQNKLPDLFSVFLDKLKETDIKLSIGEPAKVSAPETKDDKDNSNLGDITTSTIAARMGANSGPELALAASAHLTFVRKMDSFTRKEILREMQNASQYYNKSYSGNFSRILDRLLKNKKLSEQVNNKYALTAETRRELESVLAE